VKKRGRDDGEKHGSLVVERELHAFTALRRTTRKGDVMKKLIAVLAFCLAVGGASFGQEHVVTRSAKGAAKGSYKAAKVTVKGTGKALRFMF
jgi:hypothetical protein